MWKTCVHQWRRPSHGLCTGEQGRCHCGPVNGRGGGLSERGLQAPPCICAAMPILQDEAAPVMPQRHSDICHQGRVPMGGNSLGPTPHSQGQLPLRPSGQGLHVTLCLAVSVLAGHQCWGWAEMTAVPGMPSGWGYCGPSPWANRCMYRTRRREGGTASALWSTPRSRGSTWYCCTAVGVQHSGMGGTPDYLGVAWSSQPHTEGKRLPRGPDYGSDHSKGATLPSTTPARPQPMRCIPKHLTHYVLNEELP